MTLQLTKKHKEKVDLIKAYFIIRRAMKEIIFRFGSGREIIIGSLTRWHQWLNDCFQDKVDFLYNLI